MINKFFKKYWLIIAVLFIAGITHGFNMLHYPYYENDEGVYVSQAWSFIAQGKLAPYTYWYDHAPVGWMFIGIWGFLTGGFFTFGTSVDSGRVFMLVLHLISSALLFYITHKISRSKLAAVIAVIFFSISPLGIYFQRRVLLDNIMVFWVLVSWALLMTKVISLRKVMWSALAFGIAILSKENAIFFIPGFLYLLYTKGSIGHRRYSIVLWITVMSMVVSSYFLYAFFKKELFPTGFLGDSTEHVSLLETLKQQSSRGRGFPFWNSQSDFYLNFLDWFRRDSYLMSLGILSSIGGVILMIKEKSLRAPMLMVIFFWIFLMRGKTVIDFYVVPLIPFFGLLIGYYASKIANSINKLIKVPRYFLYILIIILIFYPYIFGPKNHYTADETTNQRNAINWMKTNLNPDDYIVIDNYGYLDLQESRFSGDPKFVNADWFWKLQSDPEIKSKKYKDNWRNIEYIALTHEMLRQTKQDNTQNFVDEAFDYSYPVKFWRENITAYLDFVNNISTNGDWVGLYKVKDVTTVLLEQSWKNYLGGFKHSYGQIIDTETGITTSEGQSYAMLRATWIDDKQTFEDVWSWTRDHMQHRAQDKLVSWKWEGDDKTGKITDNNSATDGDQDIALALIFASKKWNNPQYLAEAKALINSIWENEVVEIRGQYYLISGVGAQNATSYFVNPSYLSPAWYEIYATVDPDHDWKKLKSDSYIFLNQLKGEDNQLPHNWVLIDKRTGAVKSATSVFGLDADSYGFDAFRVFFRVGLDKKWFDDSRADAYLDSYYPFFSSYYETNKQVPSIIKDGVPTVEYNAMSTNAGVLPVLLNSNQEMSNQFYDGFYTKLYNEKDAVWGDKNNYYGQNWSWFISAYYYNRLDNLAKN